MQPQGCASSHLGTGELLGSRLQPVKNQGLCILLSRKRTQGGTLRSRDLHLPSDAGRGSGQGPRQVSSRSRDPAWKMGMWLHNSSLQQPRRSRQDQQDTSQTHCGDSLNWL